VFKTVLAQVAGEPPGLAHQPYVVKVGHPGGLADITERVDVTIAEPIPVLERNPKLEAGLCGAHELALLDAEQRVKRPERRDSRLAHAHRANLIGLHQRDVEQGAQLLREHGRHCPAGGAASGDDDAFYGLSMHGLGPGSFIG
jgi:hypothetical protein